MKLPVGGVQELQDMQGEPIPSFEASQSKIQMDEIEVDMDKEGAAAGRSGISQN